MTSQEDGRAICPESTIESANRRNFIRKAAIVTAAGMGGALLAGAKMDVLPQSSAKSAAYTYCNLTVKDRVGIGTCCPTNSLCVKGSVIVCGGFSAAIAGKSCASIGVQGISCSSVGVKGTSTTCAGVCACSDSGVALCATSGTGLGLQAASNSFLIGRFRNSHVTCCGDRTALIQFENGDITPLEWNIGIAGVGNGLAGITDGEFYVEQLTSGVSNGARMVINTSGKVGIGTTAPSSRIDVVTCCSCFPAISGTQNSTAVCASAIHGLIASSTPGVNSAAVVGENSGSGGAGIGVFGFQRGSGWGVNGESPDGVGVRGYSCNGTGVYGCSINGSGVIGESGSSTGAGVMGLAGKPGSVPIIAKGACGQTANLQEWQSNSGTVYAVINKAGSLGLGGVTNPHHVLCISGKAHASSGFSIGPCTCINTTLAVNGSFAAKTRTVGSTQTLLTTDYAILATGTITLTLPPAKTQNGMMIFIKNTSTGTISVVPGGTDSIEGSSTARTLTKQYDSLTLISNGSNEWFIQSGVKCGAVLS